MSSSSEDEAEIIAQAKAKASITTTLGKGKHKKSKSGGFQSMGLEPGVLRGVLKKGYRVPTPIQRRAIPLVLEGRDVVAMARTGSGKTAAFVVPMLHRLLTSSMTAGVSSSSAGGGGGGVSTRALVVSPTRELALQTAKFVKELARFTGLRSACVLGGESMEKHFALMHRNPDVLVATPGRLVHLCVEMQLNLKSVQYVVFDEADRLFEMGFGEQLKELLGRLPESRQTLLFSATLPKLLLDFAGAGLTEPTLVRLDVETKMPETLKMAFFSCRSESKASVLLYLLTHVIPKDQQVLVFAATRHHVEHLALILKEAGSGAVGEVAHIYSGLDPTARKINAAKFQGKRCRVLLVTDLAARGIDIPMLDNVVNYHFPAKSKLFVHRCGRVARAGRTGRAYSLVAGDELAYLMDLKLFLGHKLATTKDLKSGKASDQVDLDEDRWHNAIGDVPQSVYDEYDGPIQRWHEFSADLQAVAKVAANGFKQYLKSRPGASAESVKRAKALKTTAAVGGGSFGLHPLLCHLEESGEAEASKRDFIEQMKNYRPSSTIFEIGNTAKTDAFKVAMSQKRQRHCGIIERHHLKLAEAEEAAGAAASDEEETPEQTTSGPPDEEGPRGPSQEDIMATFGQNVIHPKAVKNAKVFVPKNVRKRKAHEGSSAPPQKKGPKRARKDEENFIGYQAKDHHTEAGYSLVGGFEAQASHAVLDLTGDDEAMMRKKKNLMRWDAKKKRYIKAEQDDKKKIKTESGVWIPASYKSDRYAKWKERTKLAQMEEEPDSDNEDDRGSQRRKRFQGMPKNHPAMKKAQAAVPKHRKGPRNEILRPEQILKQRKARDRMRAKNQGKRGSAGGGGGDRGGRGRGRGRGRGGHR